MWKEILRKDKLAEQISSINAKYVVDFDMQEVEKSLRKEVVEKVSDTQGSRALWISKRWWLYRPKLPYTYFLDKLDCSEVIILFYHFYQLSIIVSSVPFFLVFLGYSMQLKLYVANRLLLLSFLRT